MSSFTDDLIVKWLDPDPGVGFWQRIVWGDIRAELVEPFSYYTHIHPQLLKFNLSHMRAHNPEGSKIVKFDPDTHHLLITAPKGYVSDFATIPKPLWSVLHPTDARFGKAAIIHDILYTHGIFNKRWADAVFYEAMGVRGVPDPQRKLMHFAVSHFGRGAY